jgi:hypothetical protein
MEKWEPIFWIVGSGIGFFVLLMVIETLKTSLKTRRRSGA